MQRGSQGGEQRTEQGEGGSAAAAGRSGEAARQRVDIGAEQAAQQVVTRQAFIEQGIEPGRRRTRQGGGEQRQRACQHLVDASRVFAGQGDKGGAEIRRHYGMEMIEQAGHHAPRVGTCSPLVDMASPG